jgi:hypothetical protein
MVANDNVNIEVLLEINYNLAQINDSLFVLKAQLEAVHKKLLALGIDYAKAGN